MTTSPSRKAGYSSLMVDAVARDGLTCFLCGQIHTRTDTMQVDFRKPLENGGQPDSDNAIPVCKPCAKRRNQSPVGTYWRKRLIDAQREISYIHQMAEDTEILRAIAATVRVDRGVPLREGTGAQAPSGEVKPWENLPRRVRFYNSAMLGEADYDRATNRPRHAQHGDVYADYGNADEEYIYDSASRKWLYVSTAQERGVIPEQWPPADVEQWKS